VAVGVRIGRGLRRGRRAVVPDQDLGACVVVGVLGALLHPALGLAGAALALGVRPLGAWRRRVVIRRRVVRDLPDVIDLLVLAVSAGTNTHLALEVVAREGEGPVAEAFASALGRTSLGVRLQDALVEAPDLGDGFRSLADVLRDADALGAPLLDRLRRSGTDARRERSRARLASVRAVPVKLLFPLVLCTLPGFGLLTVVPMVLRAMPSLVP
jgi:tight adherence protein C